MYVFLYNIYIYIYIYIHYISISDDWMAHGHWKWVQCKYLKVCVFSNHAAVTEWHVWLQCVNPHARSFVWFKTTLFCCRPEKGNASGPVTASHANLPDQFPAHFQQILTLNKHLRHLRAPHTRLQSSKSSVSSQNSQRCHHVPIRTHDSFKLNVLTQLNKHWDESI